VKRTLLPLALLFAAAGFAAAQAEFANFVQEGRATRGITAPGLQAAHPSLPIGSTPTVRNVATGAEVAVTVTGRIPVSTERVIDVSADAARAIGLDQGGYVLVFFPSNPSPPPAAEPVGVNITIHNHVIPRSALPAWLERRYGTVQYAPLPPAPPPFRIRYAPAIPPADGDGVYRLRVGGVWEDTDYLQLVLLRLLGEGFNRLSVDRLYGRVFIDRVPAADVYSFVRRLDAMDFEEVYIMEY